MAKSKSTTAKKTKKIAAPKKTLQEVSSKLSSVRRPLYAINKKIKNASSKYYERKFKKEREAYLRENELQIQELSRRKSELKRSLKEFEFTKKERTTAKRKATSIEKQIQAAIENKDIAAAEKLKHKLLKQLQEIDKLTEKLGVELNKTDPDKYDKKDYKKDEEAGFIPDPYNPYAIWEAIKQFHTDLESGEWDFIIVNGKRYSTNNPIQLTAEASDFWINSKEKTDGTPYVLIFRNDQTRTSKYKIFAS